jgi:D-alanyl-D-alanine dipeptidase
LRDPELEGITIRDSGEQLEEIATEGRIHVSPAYAALGFRTASNTILLRSQSAKALRDAAAALPPGQTLVVWDGLRSLATQEEIAARFNQELKAQKMSDEQRVSLLHRYVAPLPKTKSDFETAPPAHSTGGAVDVTLGDLDGNPLDLGAGFDEFSDYAALDYFERVDHEKSRDSECRDLRRILYWTMVNAGFAPYSWEFWHFEFGTRRSAAFKNLSFADYGPVVPWEQFGGKNDSEAE